MLESESTTTQYTQNQLTKVKINNVFDDFLHVEHRKSCYATSYSSSTLFYQQQQI